MARMRQDLRRSACPAVTLKLDPSAAQRTSTSDTVHINGKFRSEELLCQNRSFNIHGCVADGSAAMARAENMNCQLPKICCLHWAEQTVA
mmetsp:Transcript_44034/g.116464  ORF Transcript_44034/g.116464 Transcript_44034/m.116464 type:complete len:90 (-) Transcript_44034:34-303(-)